MNKPKAKKSSTALSKKKPAAPTRVEASFLEVVELIQQARQQAFQAVNTTLIDLYWRVGEYISHKVATAAWGESVIKQLAVYIAKQHPELKGFTWRNLFRMRQFFEVYQHDEKLSPLVTILPWTHNLIILSQCKRREEREFYLRLCIKERWSKRELERQITNALFERAVLNPPQVSAVLRQLHAEAETIFKDSYLVDFLALPEKHSEADLQRGLVAHLRRFIIELGRDFCFVGEQYVLQVGKEDFRIDLLFFQRELQALVGFELKIGKFKPGVSGTVGVLSGSARPRCAQAARTALDWRLALRIERYGSGGVCAQPFALAGVDCRISNAIAG